MKLFFPAIIFLYSTCSGLLFSQSGNDHKSSITIRILVPASEYVDTSIHKILILPNRIPQGSFIMGNIDGQFSLDTLTCADELYKNAIGGFTDKTNGIQRFTIIGDPNINPAVLLEGLSWSKADSICQLHQTDALLTLEQFNIAFTGHVVTDNSLRYITSGTEGEVSEYSVYRYIANYKVGAVACWKIYDSKHRKIIERRVYLEDSSSSEYVESFNEAIKLPKGWTSFIYRLAQKTGATTATIISPNWIPAQRTFYDSGNRDMRKAAKLMSAEKTREALQLWKNNLKNSNKTIALHARYNVILGYEILGFYEDAFMIAHELWENYGMMDAGAYADLLKLRIGCQLELVKQLPSLNSLSNY
jgi:hypothetical protein